MNLDRIRNFCIIAHIDHGKTTLSDRILEATKAVSQREMQEQFLDAMDLERERGITIKAHSVSLNYTTPEGENYLLNLIDTPGHVDFHYEVSRALAACEGALLVVDASQGVEAQTLANAYLATDLGLELVPVINKIDLPSAEPERVRGEIEDVIGIDATDAILASAKDKTGITEILDAIVKKLPPPKGDPSAPPRAMIFDSWYDSYRGVITLIRIIDGKISVGEKLKFMASGKEFQVEGLGIFTPAATAVKTLEAGQVGFLIGGIKDPKEIMIGDTVTSALTPTESPLPGFKKVKPMVFAGLFPVDPNEYPKLREALEKLGLNDSSFVYEPETSEALGFGFRCGFLGFLHMEIVQERLEREFNLDLITTAPNVVYRIKDNNGEMVEIVSPSKLPEPHFVEEFYEPYARVSVFTKSEFVGNIFKLFEERRGNQTSFHYASKDTVIIEYSIPLSEIIVDFYDKLKTYSGVRLHGLHDRGIQGIGPGEGGHPREHQTRGRPLFHFAQGAGRIQGKDRGVEAEGRHTETAFRGGHPGRDIKPRDRQDSRQTLEEERPRQVLRRRHQQEEEAPREAERGQEEDEDGGRGADPAGSVPLRPESG